MTHALVTLLSSSVNSNEITQTSNGIAIGRERHRGRLAYKHIIYRGIDQELISDIYHYYPHIHYSTIELLYKGMNGARLFSGQISIRGFIGNYNKRIIDDLGQPVSLRYGNDIERPKHLNSTDFVIGSVVDDRGSATIIVSREGRMIIDGPLFFDCERTWDSPSIGILELIESRMADD